MIYLLILFPLLMAAITYLVPSNRYRPLLLPVGALGQLGLVLATLCHEDGVKGLDGWLQLDALGKVVLGFLTVLFFLCALYAPAYLALRAERSNRVFCANLFAALA